MLSNMFASDSGSERATSIEDYQNTCTEFITDISHDYMDWIERYQLGEEETTRRKATINHIVKTTNDWIVKYGTTIKKIDIVMNDGVNKMARFTIHPIGEVRVNIKATPRSGRLTRVGNYQKGQLLLINSSSSVKFSISKESMKAADVLDDYIIIDANNCHRHDLISLTSVVEEIESEYVTESRGYTTIILLV